MGQRVTSSSGCGGVRPGAPSGAVGGAAGGSGRGGGSARRL